MKVVGYINTSRKHSVDRDVELKIQRERISDFCNKNSYILMQIYEESPDSRPDFKPELLKILNESSQDKFEKVIILKSDVIDNDETIKDWVKEELKKNNVSIVPIIEPESISTTQNQEEIDAKIKLIKTKVRDIPSLPEVVTKVMELVQDPNSSALQLGKVIAHDPGLTSRVLRLVNSAYYGFPKQISSIQHAVMILGFTTMRGLVLSSSIFKLFAPKGDKISQLDYKEFWKHSLICALVSRNIQRFIHFNAEEDIFSAAILHDIGKIILDQYDHENYVNAINETKNEMNAQKIIEAEQKYCAVNHSDIGYIVAESWNLPSSISNVIKYHHKPLETKDNTTITSIVYLANILSFFLLNQKPVQYDLFDEEVLSHLGLSYDDIPEINMKAIEEVENIVDLESFFK